jgi:hypothetical protein
MPKVIIVFGWPNSGKTTYAMDLVESGECQGLVSIDNVLTKIMHLMNQKNYRTTSGASRVKSIYWDKINFPYLLEQFVALEILKLPKDVDIVIEGLLMGNLDDRRVVYNVLKLLGYQVTSLIKMPGKKDRGNSEFQAHEVTSYQVTCFNGVPLRHPPEFYERWRRVVAQFGDI